jgi:hypothetical protein
MRQCLDWLGQIDGDAIRNLDPLEVRRPLGNRIMARNGVMIAGLTSGSGKTLLTLGLLRACAKQRPAGERC